MMKIFDDTRAVLHAAYERAVDEYGTYRETSENGGVPSEDDLREQHSLPDDYAFEIDRGTAFSLLSNDRRRAVVRHINSESDIDPASISSFSTDLAAYENDKPVEMVTSKERKRAYIPLYQSHLPALADADAIAYDRSRGTFEAGPKNPILSEFVGPSLQQGKDDLYTDVVGVPADELFTVLKNDRRRGVLAGVQQNDEIYLGELTRDLAAIEEDKPLDAVTDKDENRLYVSLYQNHIPTLEASGLVAYDRDERLLSATEDTDRVQPFLGSGFYGETPITLEEAREVSLF